MNGRQGERQPTERVDARDGVRVWLVERSYDDRNLITLVYATPDGSWVLRKERSAHLFADSAITAAITVPPDRLEPVDHDSTRERYANEVARMTARHDPADEI